MTQSGNNVLVRFKYKLYTEEEWENNNSNIPLAGELCFTKDTGKFKVGTGDKLWSQLPYADVLAYTKKSDLKDPFILTDENNNRIYLGNLKSAVPCEIYLHGNLYGGNSQVTYTENELTNNSWNITSEGSATFHTLNLPLNDNSLKINNSNFFNGNFINSKFLPSYVDDVREGCYDENSNIFYEELAHTHPMKGEQSVIYVDLGGTNNSYRWTGSKYQTISSGTADRLTTARNISLKGDITGNTDFDGSKAIIINTSLKNLITAATIGENSDKTIHTEESFMVPQLKVDEKGRITDIKSRSITISISNVTGDKAGLMTAEDKRKFDSLIPIENAVIDNWFNN